MLMLTWGIWQAVLSTYLADAKQCLLIAFQQCPESSVEWPDTEVMWEMASLVAARQPQLTGIFGFVDELNLSTAEP